MSALTAARPLSARLGAGWISSPAWDLFWMFSALWGAVLLLTGSAFARIGAVAFTLFFANRLISIYHSWSTTYMVLFSTLLEEERRKNRRKYVAIPWAIALGSVLLGLYISGFQRYPVDGRVGLELWGFILYIGLFWIGHFWHFGNQDFGVLTIYRARAGQSSLFERKVDKIYTAVMMFVIQPIVYLNAVTTTAFSEMVHSFAPLDPALWSAAATAGVGVAAVITICIAGFELSKPNRSLPKLLYYGVILLHPVLLYCAVRYKVYGAAYLYIMAYLWSHWFIAIGLVTRINSNYYRSRGDSENGALLRHAVVLGVIALSVWLLTYGYVDFGLFNTDGFEYKKILAGIQPEQRLVIGLFLGFFLGEQLLHYYCDRCLFRFRDAGVRRKVAPLLL